ncbi:hypothetical protein ScPMuIL_003359 [Solemya velum]
MYTLPNHPSHPQSGNPISHPIGTPYLTPIASVGIHLNTQDFAISKTSIHHGEVAGAYCTGDWGVVWHWICCGQTFCGIWNDCLWCSRNVQNIEELSKTMRSGPGSLNAIKCDVSNEDEVLAMFAKIRKERGCLDVCVNSAGISHGEPLLSGTTEKWRDMLNTNVIGLFICTREAVKSMRESGVGNGHIILLNSRSGHMPASRLTGQFYTASKYSVTALTEGFRRELRELKSGIRIAGVSPGLVETGFSIRNLGQERGENIYKLLKCLTADDIADSVIYALEAPGHVQELSKTVRSGSGSLNAIQCDVSIEDEVLAMFAKIRKEQCRFDVCVISAGTSHGEPLLSGTTEKWRDMLNTNVIGLCICTREALKLMRDSGVDNGHIILLNSIAGHMARPRSQFYSATKYAVTALTEGFSRELRELKSGIRITGVSPGLVETGFAHRAYGKERGEAIYRSEKSLIADDIADSLIYALEAPDHVQVTGTKLEGSGGTRYSDSAHRAGIITPPATI